MPRSKGASPMAVEQSLSNTPPLNVGDEAPDFNLPASTGDKIALSQYRNAKNVVLAFFPYAFSKTCSAQMPSYQADLDRFNSYDTQVLGVSMDSLYALKEW